MKSRPGQRLGGQIAQSVAELHAKVHARHLVHHLGHGAHHLAGLFRHGVQLSIIHVLCHRGDHALPRRRLFKHVPWLVERIVSSVEEYAIGLVIDTSHLEEVTRELNLESGDPQAIQDAMSKLQGMDLSPRITSKNTAAASRLETLLALVEGWAEHVVTEALGERIPSTSKLTQAWAHRRSTGGSAEKAFSKVVGIELNAPKVSEAAELWRRATVAVGAEKRDKAWDHPDFLPTAEHLDNPAAFIDSLLDEGPDEGFEEEFAKLEEMLKNGEDSSAAQGDESKESEKPEDQDDKKDKGNEDEEN